MLKLQDFRAVYPEYNNLTDYELSTALHRTHYADMPYEQFAQGFGGPLQEDKAETAARDYNAVNPEHPITAQDIRDKDRSGIWGGIRLLGEGIYDAVTDQFPEDMARVWRGGDIDPANPGMADSIIRQQAKDSAARIPSIQEVEGDTLANSLYQGPKSVATSMATGIAGSLAGGAAGAAGGSVVPGIGTAAGGLVGSMLGGATMSGAAFYRMAKDQFVDEVQQAMQRSMGRTMTSEEAAELNRAIDADATEYGLWEAGPEAISQFFTLGLIKGAGGMALKKFGMGAMADAIGKRALTRIPAKMGAELGEEETTEGITYFGQEGIRQRYGLRPDAPTLGEFARDQAGPVAVGSLLQLGGMRAAEAVGRRMRRRADDVSANTSQDDGVTPPPPEAQSLSEHDVTPAAPYVFEQSPENMPVPVSPGEFISDTDAADIDAFVRDYEAREQAQADAAMLSEYGRPEARRFTPLQLALEEGNPIDLLALPPNATGVAQGIGGLALPPGTGALPMGTRVTGQGPIAPPTDFASAPLTTPFTPRPALPQQAGPSAGQGRWAGGRSQLAYGGGMMQGLGFVGGQDGAHAAPAGAMPTASQITNTQTAPRADTTAQAEALGMPAPNPLAPGIDAAERPAVQTPTTQNTALDSQSPIRGAAVPPVTSPEYNYYLPSFVTEQYGRPKVKTEGTSTSPAPQAQQATVGSHESRADLLQQLPPESRKEARRLTNSQLRERIRAEQNPVKFDGETIDYTVEDYPMPTAQSGTVFTSASGRRLSPFPQVDYSTNRKHKASNAKVAAWLLDEARKEAAPNEWRSLLIRGRKADNLSPSDVRDLVDILSSGVEKDADPPFFKSFPMETERKSDAKEETGKEVRKETAAVAPRVEPEKTRAGKIPEMGASEAEDGVVKSEKTVEEGHVRVHDREAGKQPVVDKPTDMASGLQPRSGSRMVEQPEPRKAPGASGRDGDASSVSGRNDGRDAARREGGNDSGGGMPDGRGRTGRGDAGRDTDENSGMGGERRVAEHAGRRYEVGDNPRAVKSETGGNHHIADGDTLVPGGAVARAKANINAIRLVRQLEKESRAATPEEKKILTQFTGWGSLAQAVFHPDFVSYARMEGRGGLPSHLNADAVSKYRKWKSQYGEALHPALGGILTEKEWAAAEKSTLNAHYTDRKVISAMWEMAERLGFRGGRILEPAAGTGLFFGLMPEHLSRSSVLIGVELDEMTGKILKHLYPDADIQITGFEKTKRLGDNSVDLVISNVPFGDFTVFDKSRPQYSKQSIHNYFFSRALDAVRPGGLVMQITSHYTLDSGAARLREEWGRKADLVAAVRLPKTAFEKNAGTEVTTDIIVFRKKADSRFNLGHPFRNIVTITTPQGETGINEYFAAHPEMVLGEHSLSGKLYGGNEYALLPAKEESLEEGLRRAAANIPPDVYGVEARNTGTEKNSMEGESAHEGAKEGSLVDEGDKGVFLVVDGRLEAPEWAGNKRHTEQAKAYIGVKENAMSLIAAMNSDTNDQRVAALREKLNAVYDAYVKKYGPINKRGNGFLEDDIEFPTVAALEHVTREPVEKIIKSGPNKGKRTREMEDKISKADIFSARTIFPFRAPEHADTPEDAVKISRIYKNGIDLPYIAGLLGMETNEAKAALLKTGEIFEAPESGLLEPKDIYLSGNVREKLERAERAAEDNPAYEANVAALRQVQPPRIGIDAIFARLGSSWVSPETYGAFLRHIGVGNAKVTLTRLPGDEGTATWSVQGHGLSAEARNRWGTERADILSLVEDCLNLKRTVVLDPAKDGDKTKYVRNEKETMAAQEKQRLLQEEFRTWLVGNEEHAKLAEDIYNTRFNGFVVRTFDVPDIKYYPGASHSIELRDNQKVGVSRALQESCLLAHGVGSGKTMLQITLAMEMRRLGTARKPWIVVQGSTLSQFAASFKALYPGARILAPTEKQRTAKNRRRLLAQIASGDWDAVITPHGFFNGVSVSPETEGRFIREQVSEYEDLLHGIDKDEKITRKQIEKKIERLKVRLENIADTRKDENIFFDELGVDALIIDEAHAYKRGQFVTKMDNVKGLDRDSSQRSFQMLMKARLVQDKTGGKNVVMATGTPISNTLTEMWTMFRYTRPDLLRQFGVEQFDDFATTFATTSISQEETATGEWKDVERFNKYVNGPELLTLWRSGADVAITEDLTSIKGLPKLQGGKIHEVPVERSEALSNYIEALRQERLAWDRLTGKEKRAQSHVPLTIYGRAKQAAIDLRLVDSTLPDEPNSKANIAVQGIFERWQANQDTNATQIVFSDTFQSRDKAFNLFEDIRCKLVKRGIPQKEIAVIHDFKTDEARKKLFDAVNRGGVRVLMGTTEKLGVGVNVQERLLTAHHLDAPQRPMDFEQRNGRIRRPGNVFPEVEILTYGTKNTLDSVTFQQLISKQKFINQLLRGNVSDRSFENPFDATQATFEDMMAAFSGNPLAKEKMQLTADVRRLRAMLSSHVAQVSGQRSKLRSLKAFLERQEERLSEANSLTEYIERNFPGGKIEGKKQLSKEIDAWLETTEAAVVNSISDIHTATQWYTKKRASFAQSREFDLGHGLSVTLAVEPYIDFAETKEEQTEYGTTSSYRLQGPHDIKQGDNFSGAQGLFTRLGNALSSAGRAQANADASIKDTRAQIAALEEEIKRPFAQQNELDAAKQRLEEVESELEATTKAQQEEKEEVRDDSSSEDTHMASLAPAAFLPKEPSSRRSARRASIERVAKRLGERAKRAAPVSVVGDASELPVSISRKHADSLDTIEGAYDTHSKTVWLVAGNLSSETRAAEVWAHEQFVHHGLRGLFTDTERKHLLGQLWTSLGGMQNQAVREVAELYGLDPRSDVKARLTVMEEVVASMAEKRAMDSMTPQELSLWKRIVNAVLRAWNNLVGAVSGRSGSMGFDNVDQLLSYLGGYVMDGRMSPGFGLGGNMGFFSAEGVFPSLRTSPAPKDTVRAYKLFRVRKDKPGKLFPLFVGADEAIDTGIWLDAEIGPDAGNGKVKSKLGALAMRPGWHAGDAPVATHIGDKANIRDKAPSFRPENQVWAEVELANDIDWQMEANQRAQRNKAGNIIPRTAHITDRIPTDGLYRYKTNPNMTGNWIIAGSMKVNRILSDAEVERINKKRGVADLPRKQPFDAEKYGFSEVDDDAPLASLSPRGILDMTVRGAAKSADAPEIRHLIRKNDISLLQGIIQLPHWIAKQAQDFAKVYERQLRRMDERSAALKKSLETVPSMFGKQRLEAADMDSLRKLLWEHEGKEPKELEGIEKFLTEETLATGRELIKVNPEFYDAYKKWLGGLDGTKAAKAAMLEIRKSLDEDLVQAHNRMAAMSEMSDDAITAFRQSIGHVPNYFPHHRYGGYFVQAKVGKDVVFRQHFDALGEKAAMAKARKIVEEQRKNYPDAEWSDGKNDRLPDEVLGAPIDSEAMEQIIRAATAKIGDKERAREINKLLAEGVSDVLKARGWGAHGIQRKGIPGFETEDIARVLYDYKAGLNGWLTKMEAARDFSEALSGIDARKTPHLWKYTAQYVKDMLRNSDRVDRVTGNIKAVAFAWYLGGSIKTAFVNATQNLVVGVPRLQMDVTGGGREWLAGAQGALVDRVTGNKGKGLTEDEARLVRELYGESVITDAFMEEVRGQLRGVSGASLWNKFTKVLGWPMSEVERFNRASLALAAFRAARTGKLKARAREKYGVKGKANYEQAKAFASDVVRDAHFVYGKSNMPEFMRSNTAGRAMASMYTFRTFTHNMVAMWAWALKTQGKEGAAFVAKSLGATMALGGVTALPLYATLMALFQAVTGDDDDWTELIRSHLPESNLLRDVVCYGTPAMAGVNIGGSLKMETPLTKGLTGGKTPQEVLTDSIGDIIGIPYDLLVVKPSRVMEAHSKGNTWRMLEEAAPVAVKNGMQAWRLYSEGQTTMTGRPINDPGEKGARRLSSGESFGKFLGFQPVSSTKSYDAYAATKHADQVRSDKIDELTVLALKTYDTGDSAGRREANRELREWNEKMKAEGKPHMLINLKDVMRRVKSRRRENRATPKAMQKRERQQAVWG